MKKLILSLFFLSAFTLRGSAQLQGLEVVKVPEAQQPYSGEYIYIPDVEGYKTLKCDFHTHTIFSDGDIKPENRVWEAAIRGLDVIAITDHIEYRPNKDYIKADHNESYKKGKDCRESFQSDSNSGSRDNPFQADRAHQCSLLDGCQCGRGRSSESC